MALFNNGKIDMNQLDLITQQRTIEYELRLQKWSEGKALIDLNRSWQQRTFFAAEIRSCISTFADIRNDTTTRKLLKYLETYSLEKFTDELRIHLGAVIVAACNNKIIYNSEMKLFEFKSEECETSQALLPIKKKWYQTVLDRVISKN